jgi:hypothetical protein
MKRPKDWRAEVTPIYLEEGQAIGRIIMHDRTQESYIWSLLGGTDVWPRWYLFAFATLYRESHATEYNTLKSQWRRGRKKKKARAEECEEARRKALGEGRVW